MYSMTGYGKAERSETTDAAVYTAAVEIRSVNGRYAEVSCKAHPAHTYPLIEDKLVALVKKRVARGTVDIRVTITVSDTAESATARAETRAVQRSVATNVKVDIPLATEYIERVRELILACDLEDDLRLSDVLKIPGLFTIVSHTSADTAKDNGVIEKLAVTAADDAVTALLASRAKEGAFLLQYLREGIADAARLIGEIEVLYPENLKAYNDKAALKMRSWPGADGTVRTPALGIVDNVSEVNHSLITETILAVFNAAYHEKIAIDEELSRLNSHVDAFLDTAEGGNCRQGTAAVGRKLDFLIQEMNRETNTIASKSQSAVISQLCVELKSTIEKIREQVQNVE